MFGSMPGKLKKKNKCFFLGGGVGVYFGWKGSNLTHISGEASVGDHSRVGVNVYVLRRW